MIEKIVSGGQTGVDQAALKFAVSQNIPYGGWCPKGRKAEDGTIPEEYVLQETESADYSERTKLNIRDSDATLILVPKLPLTVTDGTILTIQEVQEKNKSFLIVDLSQAEKFVDLIKTWIEKKDIKVLNIAGPRESQSPGIHAMSLSFLNTVLDCFQSKHLKYGHK